MTQVAIKTAKKACNTVDACRKLREFIFLTYVPAHPNLVTIYEMFLEYSEKKFGIVMEMMDTSLMTLMKSRKTPFSLENMKLILYQALVGLEHIHNSGFFHRDIKPENILISKVKVAPFQIIELAKKYQNIHGNFTDIHYARNAHSNNQQGCSIDSEAYIIKLADFGLARHIDCRDKYTDYISTRWYRAPELVLRRGFYSSPVDMWAFGATATEISSLKPLFPGTNETDQLVKQINLLGYPSDFSNIGMWRNTSILAHNVRTLVPKVEQFPKRLDSILGHPETGLDAIVLACLKWNPDERKKASELLACSFFDSCETATKLLFDVKYCGLDIFNPYSASALPFNSSVLTSTNTKSHYPYNEAQPRSIAPIPESELGLYHPKSLNTFPHATENAEHALNNQRVSHSFSDQHQANPNDTQFSKRISIPISGVQMDSPTQNTFKPSVMPDDSLSFQRIRSTSMISNKSKYVVPRLDLPQSEANLSTISNSVSHVKTEHNTPGTDRKSLTSIKNRCSYIPVSTHKLPNKNSISHRTRDVANEYRDQKPDSGNTLKTVDICDLRKRYMPVQTNEVAQKFVSNSKTDHQVKQNGPQKEPSFGFTSFVDYSDQTSVDNVRRNKYEHGRSKPDNDFEKRGQCEVSDGTDEDSFRKIRYSESFDETEEDINLSEHRNKESNSGSLTLDDVSKTFDNYGKYNPDVSNANPGNFGLGKTPRQSQKMVRQSQLGNDKVENYHHSYFFEDIDCMEPRSDQDLVDRESLHFRYNKTRPVNNDDNPKMPITFPGCIPHTRETNLKDDITSYFPEKTHNTSNSESIFLRKFKRSISELNGRREVEALVQLSETEIPRQAIKESDSPSVLICESKDKTGLLTFMDEEFYERAQSVSDMNGDEDWLKNGNMMQGHYTWNNLKNGKAT